jgi:tetrahydromethanopterin:alpha-L-glutamate ligase
MKLALFVDEAGGDWHARRLAKAMRARGATVVITTLTRCAFDTGSPTGLVILGFDGELPDGVFVRSIGNGSLEQITFRLGILHALRESGVRVWNDARAIERCVDKSTATFLFQRAGVPTPLTVEGRSIAADALARVGGDVVVKPLFGAQGVGIERVATPEELPDADSVGAVYYLQRFVDHGGTGFVDWRVFVSAGRVLAGMARRSESWITNVAQGAVPEACSVDGQLGELALAAAAALGADYGGVDLIADREGQMFVLEVNSNPAWQGLQSVSDVDIAGALAEDFMAAVARSINAKGSTL